MLYSINGFVNKHNRGVVVTKILKVFVEGDTQYSKGIEGLAVIVGDQVIGSLFINKTLNGDIYLDKLKNATNILITEAVRNRFDKDGNLIVDEAGVQSN